MFLQWLDRIGRKRIINDRLDREPYLERYYLFLRERQSFPFNIFLHHFLKSDPDDVHDHPWPYLTIVLKGGYYEWTPIFDEAGNMKDQRRHWRSPGHIRVRGATSYHRIELKSGVNCWTLFVPGQRHREWGFLKDNQWIQSDLYLTERAERLRESQMNPNPS